MRKLKLQMQLSLDGFVGGPNGEMDWMACPWTQDLDNHVQALTDPVTTIVLGRKLAEGFIPYWASVAEDTANPEMASGKFFTDTPKVVFTRTLQESAWANTELAKGDLTEEITKLKQQSGGDIIAYGGASFVSSLIKTGLIDEYHLFVNPTAIGKGLTIFAELESYLKLKLVQAKSFDCGIVAYHYVPVEG